MNAATPPRPGGPTRLGRALLRVSHALAWTFFIVFAISALEVGLRYGLDRPTSWVHVTSTALALLAFAVGGALAMVQGQHLRVSVLIDRAASGPQRAAAWLGLACGAVYLLGLGWGLGVEAWESVWRFDGGRWTPELTPGPPNWPLPALAKVALALGALLFLLAIADRAVRLARGEPVAGEPAPAEVGGAGKLG